MSSHVGRGGVQTTWPSSAHLHVPVAGSTMRSDCAGTTSSRRTVRVARHLQLRRQRPPRLLFLHLPWLLLGLLMAPHSSAAQGLVGGRLVIDLFHAFSLCHFPRRLHVKGYLKKVCTAWSQKTIPRTNEEPGECRPDFELLAIGKKWP